MRHLGGTPLSREETWRRLLVRARPVGAARLRLLGGRATRGRRYDRPGRLRRLQARHDAVDRGPARNGLDLRAARARPGLCQRGGGGRARLGRRGAGARPRSSRSSTRTMPPRSGSPRKPASTKESRPRYRGEPILLFRRQTAALSGARWRLAPLLRRSGRPRRFAMPARRVGLDAAADPALAIRRAAHRRSSAASRPSRFRPSRARRRCR